ncbi:MarR family winged helix-turn-helix transcriptional regulator [Streptomyces sp. NPDC101062]|uniref:MarR family winged helix-turn-helix transcriptional regulator n=1 Tax=unclassified Streptomyces TaxID=2593676 RepID=UPI002E785430|nr:MarR family transcriptional regulator [Streptomyces sp. JV176]MEE1804311.1 MarR family transcriptional regulator [Streptomyces sp. JV176]
MPEPTGPTGPPAPYESGEPDPERVAAELTAVVGRLMRRLRTTSPDDRLTPSQRSVLARLHGEGPATTAALARAEYVRPQSMRQTLAALEEQHLVERTPDPDDGRQSVVSVTETGRTTLATVYAAKQDWLSRAIADELDLTERRALADATELMRRLGAR